MDASGVKRSKEVNNLIWNLRQEDSTQYFTLVKMHLSFATDLSTDQCDSSMDNSRTLSGSRWNLTPLKRKFTRTGSSGKNIVDCAPLTEQSVSQAFCLINFLNKTENITQEGLFRKSGSLSRQQELKMALNSGLHLDLESGIYSAHDCASVLKSFLSDLPEPLLQEGHYHVHCRIADMCGQHLDVEQQSVAYSRRIKALRLVFLLLPQLNYQLLTELLLLLNSVAALQEENKMTSTNLGTMFAPHILCPKKMTPNDLQYLSGPLSTAVAFMIENAPDLFHVPLELEIDVRQYFNNQRTLKHNPSMKSMQEAPTKTIFTFIDRELTAQANDKDVTEMALAELYAYVQSLPDSAKKRRLIKQFNEASGKGTPTVSRSAKKNELRVKTLGESIKKHLFSKSLKNSKNKSQNVPSLRGDLLSTTDVCCSPELRLFRRTSPYFKANPLAKENPIHHDTPTTATPAAPLRSNTPHIKRRTLNRNPCNSKLLKCNVYNSPVCSKLPNPASASAPSIIAATDLVLSTPVHSKLRPSVSQPSYYLSKSADIAETFKEDFAVTPECNNTSPDEKSPITRALMKSNVQQRVIMTPRSRCPIIMNSSSSIASVSVQESHATATFNDDKENGKLSSSDSASLAALEKTIDASEESTPPAERRKRRMILSSSNSGGSLLGGFFKHLSTTSLVHLTSKLTSTAPSAAAATHTEALSPCLESCPHEESLNESHAEFNESLSGVFKDYLLSRSILTDNPIDLSTDNLIEDGGPDSAYGGSLPPSEGTSRESSEASLDSVSHFSKDNFTESLLFCLDGNNPSPPDPQMERIEEECVVSKLCKSSSTSSEFSLPREQSLRTCSPSGRELHFKNKYGTPVPNKDSDHSSSSIDSVKSVLFETSF